MAKHHFKKSFKRLMSNPYVSIILVFFIIILIGSIFLSNKICTAKGMEPLKFIDSFFLATSATCVTGLSTVSNIGAQFNVFGKVILSILIFIGGLGMITVVYFFMLYVHRQLKFKQLYLLRESINASSAKEAEQNLPWIVGLAVLFQVIGGFVFSIHFLRTGRYGWDSAFGYGFFHAISSFNNAGIDLFGSDSLMSFANDPIFIFETMLFIVLGGLGFVVFIDLFNIVRRKRKKLSLHSKIVLSATAFFLTFGFVAIWAGFKFSKDTWLISLFTSVTARTAGFYIFDMSTMPMSTYAVMLPLMLMGGSPVSTAGGIKTTTVVILAKALFDNVRGRQATIFNRQIDSKTRHKASVIFLLAVVFVVCQIVIVSFCEQLVGHTDIMKEIIFELVSAYGTVGLSMGLTGSLCFVSKIFVSISMFFGRIGALSIASVANSHWLLDEEEKESYGTENVFIG